MKEISLPITIIILMIISISSVECQNVPPFLQDASQSVKDQFLTLVSSAHLKTDSAMAAEIDGWVNQQTPDIRARYEQFKQSVASIQAEGEQKRQSAVALLSPAAKAADYQLVAISNDPQLIGTEKQTRIQQILNALPASVQQELQQALQN